MTEHDPALVARSWHDVTCPEGPDCRDRVLHSAAQPLAHGGILARFLERLEELEGDSEDGHEYRIDEYHESLGGPFSVRVLHLPTGITFSREGRSYIRTKADAITAVREAVWAHATQQASALSGQEKP